MSFYKYLVGVNSNILEKKYFQFYVKHIKLINKLNFIHLNIL